MGSQDEMMGGSKMYVCILILYIHTSKDILFNGVQCVFFPIKLEEFRLTESDDNRVPNQIRGIQTH